MAQDVPTGQPEPFTIQANGPDIEILPLSQVQSLFDQADAELDSEVKELSPVQAMSEIKNTHPDKRIGFLPVTIGPGLKATTARLIAYAATRDRLEREVRRFQDAYPGVLVTIRYAPEY